MDVFLAARQALVIAENIGNRIFFDAGLIARQTAPVAIDEPICWRFEGAVARFFTRKSAAGGTPTSVFVFTLPPRRRNGRKCLRMICIVYQYCHRLLLVERFALHLSIYVNVAIDYLNRFSRGGPRLA